MALHNLGFEIRHMVQTVCFLMCKSILQHDLSVLIIDIGEGECKSVQVIKKLFLCFDIITKCLVEIQVIVCNICKYSTCKIQACYTLLDNGVRTYLHKTVITS